MQPKNPFGGSADWKKDPTRFGTWGPARTILASLFWMSLYLALAAYLFSIGMYFLSVVMAAVPIAIVSLRWVLKRLLE